MNRLYHLTRVSTVLLVLASGCDFKVTGSVNGNPQPIIACGDLFGGSGGCVPPGPVPPYTPPEITVTFTQVTSATPEASGGDASISGQGTESQTPTYYPETTNGGLPTLAPGASPPGQILLEFDSSLDVSDCETLAQRAIQEGGTLAITGQGTAYRTPQNYDPIVCGDTQDCSPPPPQSGWTVTLTELDSCNLIPSGTPAPTPDWVVHFNQVTQANPPFVCPPFADCTRPDYCLAGVPNCGITTGASIIGSATVQVNTTEELGTTSGTSLSSGPLETTIDYAIANDPTNCLAVAAKAITDGRGLTVTGLGTAQVYGMVTECDPVIPGSTVSCPPSTTDALVTATQILTCTEDAPIPAGSTSGGGGTGSL